MCRELLCKRLLVVCLWASQALNCVGMSPNFSKLSKEQKAELSEWNKTTNSEKDGTKKTKSERGKSNEKWKKARIAAVSKANTKLMEAIPESHNAEMACMKATLASMT